MGDNNDLSVSRDILNVIQTGQVKSTSTANKLSLLMDSSSDEEEEEEVMPRSPKKKSKAKKSAAAVSEDDEYGFLSDGYDVELYGDPQDRAYLASLTEVQREAILYDRAQARQARSERRLLEQKIRDREGGVGSADKVGVPVTQADVKRRKLEELRAKRSKKTAAEEEEEGEATSDAYDESEDDREAARARKRKQRERRRAKREDSDEDYWQDEEPTNKTAEKNRKTLTGSGENRVKVEEIDSELFHLPLDLEYANKLRLSRDILAQWIYRDGVEETVSRCLLRVNVGADKHGQPTYRIAELKRFVPSSRVYFIKAGTPTDLAVRAVIAKSERDLRMDVISNSPFTPEEFNYWLKGLEESKAKLPYSSIGAAKKKISQLKEFHARPLTDAIIAGMIERKRQLMKSQHSSPRDLLAEQTVLEQQVRKAIEHGDTAEAESLQSDLSALLVKKSQKNRLDDDRLTVMDDLNRRNRLVNLETGRQAELMSNAGAEAAGASSTTLDPFQRRKCKPRIIGDVDEAASETVEALESVEVAKVISQPSTTKPGDTKVDLFAAHDFELDIDL